MDEKGEQSDSESQISSEQNNNDKRLSSPDSDTLHKIGRKLLSDISSSYLEFKKQEKMLAHLQMTLTELYNQYVRNINEIKILKKWVDAEFRMSAYHQNVLCRFNENNFGRHKAFSDSNLNPVFIVKLKQMRKMIEYYGYDILYIETALNEFVDENEYLQRISGPMFNAITQFKKIIIKISHSFNNLCDNILQDWKQSQNKSFIPFNSRPQYSTRRKPGSNIFRDGDYLVDEKGKKEKIKITVCRNVKSQLFNGPRNVNMEFCKRKSAEDDTSPDAKRKAAIVKLHDVIKDPEAEKDPFILRFKLKQGIPLLSSDLEIPFVTTEHRQRIKDILLVSRCSTKDYRKKFIKVFPEVETHRRKDGNCNLTKTGNNYLQIASTTNAGSSSSAAPE